MINLNRSLLSLVATFVVLSGGLFVSSAVVAGAQEYSRLSFVHLDPESGPLTFRGVLSSPDGTGDTFEMREVSFGGSAWKEFGSNAGIDATVLDAEGDVYATFGVVAYSGVAVYGGGKVFRFDPDEYGILVAVSGVPDSLDSHAVIRSPRGTEDTIRFRNNTGWLSHLTVASEWSIHIDRRDEWWVLEKVDGRWPLLVITADTIIVGSPGYGDKGMITTSTGHDSIEFRTVNATGEAGLTLTVDDEPAVELLPMTASAVQSRLSMGGKTRLRVSDGAENVFDTSVVVLPFQFLDIVVGHDEAEELDVAITERLTTRVAEQFSEYWDGRSRLVLFPSIGAEYPALDRIRVFPSGRTVERLKNPTWIDFDLNHWTDALVLEDADKKTIVQYNLGDFVGLKRTYVFDAGREGGYVYHYNEFDRSEQTLSRDILEIDTFSVGVLALIESSRQSFAVKIGDGNDALDVEVGTMGASQTDLTGPPTSYMASSGYNIVARGEIAGIDGMQSILLLYDSWASFFRATVPLTFVARSGPGVYGIDLVNITREYRWIHLEKGGSRLTSGVPSGYSSFGKIEDGDWGSYSVVANSYYGGKDDTLVTVDVDSVNNRFIVIVDGYPKDKELRIYVLPLDQIGTGEPLVPTNIFRFETTDVPEEQEYQLDLSSKRPPVDLRSSF